MNCFFHNLLTFLIVVVNISSVCLLCSCNSIMEQPALSVEKQLNQDEYKICHEMVKAMLYDDCDYFRSFLTEARREVFTEEAFKQCRSEVMKTMGEPVSFQFITTLEMYILTPYIWKIRFKRENAKGETYYSEILFRIIIGNLDGKIQVMSFNFL